MTIDLPWTALFSATTRCMAFMRGPTLAFELANPAYLQLFGCTDIVGRSVREAHPDTYGDGFFDLLDGVYESGEPHLTKGMRILVGRERDRPRAELFVDFEYQAIRDDHHRVIGVLAHGSDASETVHAQNAADAAKQLSEQRYRSLFESIDDGFCVIEMLYDERGSPYDYRYLELNAAFEWQSGLSSAKGRTARSLLPGHEQSWYEVYGRVVETGVAARFEGASRVLGRYFEVYASRVGPAGLRQVAVVFKDITERKRVELQRENLLAAELAARVQAEAAVRLREEFLATVSHELRTPLTSMLGWVQLLRSGRLPESKREHALLTIERNARSQAHIIGDLLDVSSIAAGTLRLELGVVDLRQALHAALEAVRPAADAKAVALHVVAPAPATMLGDPERLQQIVGNLLTNAIKFSDEGAAIEVVVAEVDDHIEVRVGDTGRGVHPDRQPGIFEGFRPSPGTSARGGLGLGLSLVRGLTELHGGTVVLSSTGEGQGATVTLCFPRAPSPSSPSVRSSAAAPPTAGSLEGLHVLLVEDDEDTRDVVAALLETANARVTRAHSGASGFRSFRGEPPDVVVSDIGMADEDGYALIRRIRALPAPLGGGVPTVAITAYAQAADRDRVLGAGFDHYLTKPIEPNALIGLLESIRALRSPA